MYRSLKPFSLLFVPLSLALSGPWQSAIAQGPETAGNAEVARIMREFQGRGDLGDDSQPLPPAETVAKLRVADDLQLQLVSGEPDVVQPIHVSFDDQGRMWVVQYRQYPFPAGLKVVRYDQHLRAVFDRVPDAPPNHTTGADSILVYEDSDGDGTYDQRRKVIDGLNIATSVAVGRGGIWVMNPPYLLFYQDKDRDAIPDAEPVVHLSGFGLEDTHSVANSLMFAPDGWLYGVNGSTTTAEIHVPLGDQTITSFQGQCVWRYQPEQHEFEIFAEGGGNPFGLEIDAKGQVFSGTNWGNTRGMYYPQGSYGVKNWGKHGPLTNPYAFGYFEHMEFEGDGRRFTEEFVVYDDDALPQRYRGAMLAINPLQRIAFASHLKPNGSTYRIIDFENLITSEDRWFRPVDATVGPDGNLYIADWYDTRLTHVDPRDTWHKSSGRIYRLASKDPAVTDARFSKFLPSRTRFDLERLTGEQLIELLGHPSRWFRFAAIETLAQRKEGSLAERLLQIATASDDDRSLEALWGASRLVGISKIAEDERLLRKLLQHADHDVRRWTIRLIGDRRLSQPILSQALAQRGRVEENIHVRSQLASTAARLPAPVGPEIIASILKANVSTDAIDPHLPLLVWWATEKHFDSAPPWFTAMLRDNRELWSSPLVQKTLLSRYAKRCALDGTDAALEHCAELFSLAPDLASRTELFEGLEEGLARRTGVVLPGKLAAILDRFRDELPQTDLKLRLRGGDEAALKEALKAIATSELLTSDRIELITILGELQSEGASGSLLARLSDRSIAVRRAALGAVARFSDPGIGNSLASAFQSSMDDSTGLRPIAVRVMSSRLPWAQRLIQEIDALRIDPELVTPDMLAQIRAFDDAGLNADITRIWGRVRATAEDKQQQITDLKEVLVATAGDAERGKKLFTERCAKCHRLFGEGGDVGPDLTGYERTNFDFLSLAIVDPSAAIREEYSQYQALTNDGQVIAGLLIDQTAQSIMLRTAEGQNVRLSLDQVDTFQASAVSLMPDGLLDNLSNQQLADIFRYLSK